MVVMKARGVLNIYQNHINPLAFTALVMFIQYNGFLLKMESKFAEDFTVNMVEHKYTFELITEFIQQHCIAK